MSRTSVAAYLNGHFKKVQGWCSPHIWHMIQPIADYQSSRNIHNPVAEIGVYHGKFFIGLLATKEAPALNFAIDVFDMQQFNLDGAGSGNIEIFKENITTAGFTIDQVRIHRADSMSLSQPRTNEILDETNGFSFFSVDGCHLPEHTVNDINIAMDLTVPEGIIFVDDYTNSDWPGVQEGVSKLFLSSYPRFIPLACGHNKLLLSHISYHATYLALLQRSLKASEVRFKMVRRFSYDSLNVHLDPSSTKYFPE